MSFGPSPADAGAGVAGAVGLALTVFAQAPAQAWQQETHRRIVLDAIDYMKANPASTNYAKLAAGVTRAGYTMDQFAKALGQGANGGIVLSSKDQADRARVGRQMIPHSIAMVVHVLNRAAERLAN